MTGTFSGARQSHSRLRGVITIRSPAFITRRRHAPHFQRSDGSADAAAFCWTIGWRRMIFRCRHIRYFQLRKAFYTYNAYMPADEIIGAPATLRFRMPNAARAETAMMMGRRFGFL